MIDLDAFGAMLRAERERRGLRPIDLAVAMRWSGTAPVYRYERGGPNAPRPDPDTVNLFAQVLELDYADRLTLLGFAGHIPDTEPLTSTEVAHLLDTARPALEGTSYPALIFDFRWHILALNEPYRRFLSIDEPEDQVWRDRRVTTLDLIWDGSLGARSSIRDVERVARLQLLRFKLYNRLRRHEAWYREYPACRSQYPGFVDLWEETDALLNGDVPGPDLTTIARDDLIVDLAGRELRLESSQRAIHGAYGLAGMLVMSPLDPGTDEVLLSL